MTKQELKVALKGVIEKVSEDSDELYEYMLSGLTYAHIVPLATGGKILTKKDIGNGYQGDHLFLVQKGSEYARIVTGYGTCSGCDMIFGCESWDDLLEVVDEIRDSVIWHSKEGIIQDIQNHDAEGTWYGSDDLKAWEAFKKKALTLLGSKCVRALPSPEDK